MCNTTKLQWTIVLLSSCLLISTGCNRNRTALAPFNSTYAPLAGPTTIAPPATYSLNIPGANNQNNYNGSGTNGQLPLRQATNTPIGSGINFQNGWRAAGAGNTNTSTSNSTIQGSPSGNSTSSTSVLDNRTAPTTNNPNANRTQVVAVTPPNNDPFVRNAPTNQVAQNSNANGLSFTDRTNFRTTAVDERLDQSRLPVTDASLVRAPTNFTPTTTVGQFNAPYYVPQQQQQQFAQNAAQQSQQRFANNQQFQQFQQAPRVAQTGFNQTGNTVRGNFAQPTFARPAQQPYTGLATQNRVLGQSTVYADPANDPNLQNGWRDRELTASRDSLNR